jgi:hypothetical protein
MATEQLGKKRIFMFAGRLFIDEPILFPNLPIAQTAIFNVAGYSKQPRKVSPVPTSIRPADRPGATALCASKQPQTIVFANISQKIRTTECRDTTPISG